LLILKKKVIQAAAEEVILQEYTVKTKVGWWKNGYPECFAKVLNVNWLESSSRIM
jgi:hypothetical protein